MKCRIGGAISMPRARSCRLMVTAAHSMRTPTARFLAVVQQSLSCVASPTRSPLGQAWDVEVVPLLRADVTLNAVTLLEELQRRHPGQYDTAVLRTLQRRVRQWRAVHGAEREVYFAQEHPPGRLGLSDFTVCDALGVFIGEAAFPHRLYQFALAHSGWRHVTVVAGGESFIGKRSANPTLAPLMTAC